MGRLPLSGASCSVWRAASLVRPDRHPSLRASCVASKARQHSTPHTQTRAAKAAPRASRRSHLCVADPAVVAVLADDGGLGLLQLELSGHAVEEERLTPLDHTGNLKKKKKTHINGMKCNTKSPICPHVICNMFNKGSMCEMGIGLCFSYFFSNLMYRIIRIKNRSGI